MTPQERKKLERLAHTLEESLSQVHALLREVTPVSAPDRVSERVGDEELDVLRALGRSEAENKLSDMKQSKLGSIFVKAGGPPADRKKPKVWLVEQILWRLFDFDRGHEAIRGKSPGNS